MAASPQPTPIPQVGKLVSVVPVGLKEAALDSPTFRATTVHFADQIEYVERWLDGYAKAAGKLASELTVFEQSMTSFMSFMINSLNVSEAVIDHDYTLLAVKRSGDCLKDTWGSLLGSIRKADRLVVDPIKNFIQGDLRTFKETRRTLEHTQRNYDHLLSRYSGQAKQKEPSALREDAFQLHEARKAYLKASLDFSIQAPQVRNTLDKLLVKISFDQWRETKLIHDHNITNFPKWGQDMDRIKGWVHEMENSERYSLKELLSARKQIEDAAELATRPSRELDDYSVSTVPYLGQTLSIKSTGEKPSKAEKQGWVYLRTTTGKPTRTVWVHRWAFLKNGIFGCLVQSSRTGGVEETERIGVLLCNIRPAFQEERRFCFEVKTKKNTIMLQAENQKDLMEWIGVFEAAKQKALENPASSVAGKLVVQDPAFSISQPPAPEFTSDSTEFLTSNAGDDPSNLERTPTLPVPDRDPSSVRASGDFANSARRIPGLDGEAGSGRDHASRIIQKFDIHRKSTSPVAGSPIGGSSGGIASLITASHSLLPYSPATVLTRSQAEIDASQLGRDDQATTLAPSTLANPPAPTSMSKVAVAVSNERGIGVGLADSTGGMPSGMMANLWGSANWGFVNTFHTEGIRLRDPKASSEERASAASSNTVVDDSKASAAAPSTTRPAAARHRQTVSLDGDASKLQRSVIGLTHEYPSYYPQQLRFQDAQFRLLFPHVKREESLVMVFRATWNPNDNQEFPGRAFVTTQNLYFYSHHFGLVLTASQPLDSVSEVTAASGRDCDFLFLHIVPMPGTETQRRVTVKTFLEPLRLLQKRLNYMIKVATSEEPTDLETIFKALVKMETDSLPRSVSLDSWEDVSLDVPTDSRASRSGTGGYKDLKAPVYVEKDLSADFERAGNGRDIQKFKLPNQPVQYVPQGNLHVAAEKVFDISSKALFHVLFGDKSVLWQSLLHERMASDIKQGPWRTLDSGHMRRDFDYFIERNDLFGRLIKTRVSDYQIIDVLNDHLCYVVTDKRTPWHLPFRRNFRLVSKIVVTYISKSKCKLAIYTKVEWLWSPYVLKSIIDRQAMNDLEQDALDLVDLISDQVRKLGPRSRTKRAITIFGLIGHEKGVFQYSTADARAITQAHKSRKQRSLTYLIFESTVSFLESAVSALMMWFLALVRWIWKTCNAHSLILVLLGSSLLINGFYSTRDTYEWWHERKATSLLTRLGVHSDNFMSKAIYVRDLEDAIAYADSAWARGPDSNSSYCFSTFHEQMMFNNDNPLSFSSKYPTDDYVEWNANRRLRATRQRLGTYRHDLVVALRVVNRIENEVLKGEWERWLERETSRCDRVSGILESQVGDREKNESVLSGHEQDVKRWYDQYCSSCHEELQQLESSLV
ncbi:transcription factor SipA3, putative [Talaromyces stipitatus ATCC 10500]|uniref:Transcription factor SipA3, putative n=1 Tax=Talaromyces stipitatus (strain ATCC 10500 / CBS 375.48 / QM 6759 / NRRL 1006) TaxID=441959 RepID=B8M5Y6_TALSN|nr:transcription factor SipA3, putative [Talaromyces stipitatus ATCC 10500]EED20113.1 transcription factor SipA3, putative [Talaromyces stipitatus ATCC 10500]